MLIRKLENGNLLVPKRAESDGIIGDGVEEIRPDQPEYQQWLTWMKRDQEALRGTRKPAPKRAPRKRG